mmetsp:Transcript_23772/g.18157  ORF Transcript_23772/g.18157 Transcript_23772/m.18157 type:complete len:220 (+) Transcript_23772:281-940(+)
MLMQPMVDNDVLVAYAIGAKDQLANIQDPRDIIQYVNSNQGQSVTYMAPSNVAGYTFYALPIHSYYSTDIAFNLWFTDSTSTSDTDCPDNHYDIGCISVTQIQSILRTIINHNETMGYVPPSIIFSHQPLYYMINLWNEWKTYGEAYDNVTCNPTVREDINNLFFNSSNNIAMFVCAEDIDNNYIGIFYQESPVMFMYARSTGFVGYNQTDRGASLIRL